MRVDKISDTSVEFILTLSELKEKDINIDRLTAEDKYTNQVITKLIEEAEMEHEIFIKNNGKFKLYITTNSKNELSIIISSFDPYGENYNLYEQLAQQLQLLGCSNNYSANILENKLREKINPNLPAVRTPQKNSKINIIYCFESIDDIKLVLSDLDISFKDEILYKYKSKYYLILCMKSNISKKTVEFIFGEYATLINQSNFELVLQEYGEAIIKTNARKIIDFYF